MIRRGVSLLALCAALGCERGESVRLAVIGDFGSDTASEAQVAALVREFRPDLVATVGDNDYPDGAADTIDRNVGRHYHEWIAPYKGTYGPGAEVNRFFPALGNHDWRTAGAKPYLDYFELPGNERYYTVRRDPLELFVVDSDPHEPDGITADSAQARWLRASLAASNAPHRIVIFHHPPFSSGPHGSTPELQWPFREWGATAVLSGHDHGYERFELGGMPYVVVGTGGARLYKPRRTVPGSQVRIFGSHGALRVQLERAGGRAEFASSSDGSRDAFALPVASDLAPPRALVASGDTWSLVDGKAVPPAWLEPGFDATAWAAVPTPFRLVDAGASGKPHTTYYRREFTLDAAPGAFAQLLLGLPRDQPALARLNGREVARVERSKREGAWLVPRGPRADAPSPILCHFMLEPALLRTGANVLAIEVVRDPAEGGDPAFAAELTAYPAPGAPPGAGP